LSTSTVLADDSSESLAPRRMAAAASGISLQSNNSDLSNTFLAATPHESLGGYFIDSSEKVLRSFNTWSFKREQPSDQNLMRQFIGEAIAREAPVPFVLYWGKGPRCGIADPDVQCLDYLARLGERVRAVHTPGAALTLIFTDTHAALNGHEATCIQRYFSAIAAEALRRRFEAVWLAELVARAQPATLREASQERICEETIRSLSISALKWFRGEGTPEEGAQKYYRANMIERKVVEQAFSRSVFITFNSSKLRNLFPTRLPVFYMYSLRRGVSVKPWFLPRGHTAQIPCHCVDSAATANPPESVPGGTTR
jgi:L-tyrosine isonitrile synthase